MTIESGCGAPNIAAGTKKAARKSSNRMDWIRGTALFYDRALALQPIKR